MISAKKPSVLTNGEARNETAIIGRDSITAKPSGFERPSRLGTISAKTMVNEPITKETPVREMTSALSCSHAHELALR